MLNESGTTRSEPDGDRRDAGSALVMAVLVSVVVFVLGAMWMSIASHESSASNTDRRRQHAIDAAMAGLVVADSELSRNAAYTGSGVVAFVGGAAEFEVTVAAVDGVPGRVRRLLTSVGYAPSKADPVQTVRRVQQVVDLDAVGFTYGIFTEGQFVTGSASSVVGDVYSSTDISLGNSQDYFGRMYTLGSISTGSNQEVTGSLHANGNIHLTSNSTTLNGSAYAGGNILTGGTIRDAAQAGGTVNCTHVQGACLANSPPPPVPEQQLPSFVWKPSDYPSVTYPTSGAAFVTEVSKKASSGVFYVNGNVEFANNDDIWLAGDMTIVATGSIDLPKAIANKTTGGQAVQLTVISTGAGAITPANNLTIPSTVRTLIYTEGSFAAKNSSTFTGVLYAGDIAAGAHLSVTYAPVGAFGFDWSSSSPQSFTIRNISTREVANAP